MYSIKCSTKIIYTHRCHRNTGLPAQVLHRLLHQVGDGRGSGADEGHHSGAGWSDGGCCGGIDGNCHQLLYHLLHQTVDPRRDVEHGTSLVRGVDHGGDDGGSGIVVHLLVDGGQVVARHHLLRVPLDPLPQSHHVKFGDVVWLKSESILNSQILSLYLVYFLCIRVFTGYSHTSCSLGLGLFLH